MTVGSGEEQGTAEEQLSDRRPLDACETVARSNLRLWRTQSPKREGAAPLDQCTGPSWRAL